MNTSTYFSKFNDRQKQLQKCIEMLMEDAKGSTPLDKDLLLARLEEMQTPTILDKVKAQYPAIVEELKEAHIHEIMGSFNANLKARGTKINTTTRRDIGAHMIWSQRVTMLATAIMILKGVDPIELLIAHARSRIATDPNANELRLIEQYYDDFDETMSKVLTEVNETKARSNI
jgi:hypothetical protein